MTVDTLPDDPGTLKEMLLAERARAERLEQIIKELQRHRFFLEGALSKAGLLSAKR
jgi:transposase